jgi:hypothetical protein
MLHVFTHEQVYINWFLTLQQVKQGIDWPMQLASAAFNPIT